MRAHVLENGVVVNTIEVDSLDVLPNLIPADNGGNIGDIFEDGVFKTSPQYLATKELNVRFERNQLLTATDWTQAKDIPDAVSSKYATYRQALRDVPQQSGFPEIIVWPVKPE